MPEFNSQHENKNEENGKKPAYGILRIYNPSSAAIRSYQVKNPIIIVGTGIDSDIIVNMESIGYAHIQLDFAGNTVTALGPDVFVDNTLVRINQTVKFTDSSIVHSHTLVIGCYHSFENYNFYSAALLAFAEQLISRYKSKDIFEKRLSELEKLKDNSSLINDAYNKAVGDVSALPPVAEQENDSDKSITSNDMVEQAIDEIIDETKKEIEEELNVDPNPKVVDAFIDKRIDEVNDEIEAAMSNDPDISYKRCSSPERSGDLGKFVMEKEVLEKAKEMNNGSALPGLEDLDDEAEAAAPQKVSDTKSLFNEGNKIYSEGCDIYTGEDNNVENNENKENNNANNNNAENNEVNVINENTENLEQAAEKGANTENKEDSFNDMLSKTLNSEDYLDKIKNNITDSIKENIIEIANEIVRNEIDDSIQEAVKNCIMDPTVSEAISEQIKNNEKINAEIEDNVVEVKTDNAAKEDEEIKDSKNEESDDKVEGEVNEEAEEVNDSRNEDSEKINKPEKRKAAKKGRVTKKDSQDAKEPEKEDEPAEKAEEVKEPPKKRGRKPKAAGDEDNEAKKMKIEEEEAPKKRGRKAAAEKTNEAPIEEPAPVENRRPTRNAAKKAAASKK
ncbi:hypothetical protein ENBRE01_1410 [Enteropsectra breve]|nr:hypothetical protein ENBRE01_1033 [Enteropsectra breve]KAI5150293.1 hypothetical protein ENBRE01_1410 [Enteropsectra breve]